MVKVIMYADKMTDSMQRAIDETSRRRSIQEAYNKRAWHRTKTIIKEIRDLIAITKVAEESGDYTTTSYEDMTREESNSLIETGKRNERCRKSIRL